MNKIKAKEIVKDVVKKVLNKKNEIRDDTSLIGTDSLLDSMKLVEVCVALEDFAEENGFDFDWTSENAMSKSRSMFRTIITLADEFYYQSKTKL
jgi:acyl carrier protein